jgi:AraC-like DNA-binding protein
MRMVSYAPSPELAELVRCYTIVESDFEATRLLVPEPAIIVGFRYGGSARLLEGGSGIRMPDHSLAGLRDTARRMLTSAGGGVVLAKLTIGGASELFDVPLHEVFGKTLELDELFPASDLSRVRAELVEATGDRERLGIVECFLAARRRGASDPLVRSVARAIEGARGSVRIASLADAHGIGQDRLEKRFRHAAGASPKQVASMIRVGHAIRAHRPGMSLAELALESGYFDQSHFIRELRAVTGLPPQRFFKAEYC